MKRSALFLPACALALTALVAPTRSAHAQEASRAQALFDEARRLMTDGRYAEACPKLAASQKLDPGAGTLMNLATCYEKNGQLASAWATFKEAAAASRASGHPDWEAAARGRAEKLEPELARLVIVVPKEAQVTGLVVERDGAAIDVAEWAAPIPTDGGEHTVRASAPGRKPWSSQVTLAGPRAQVTVTVPALDVDPSGVAAAAPSSAKAGGDASVPAANEQPSSSGNTQRVVGVVLAGAGVLAVGAGAFFGLKANATYEDAKPYCNARNQCSDPGLEIASDASTQATVADVSFIAGGVLVAAGAVVFLTAPRKTTAPTSSRPSTTRLPSVSFGGPGFAGMTVGGAF